MILAIIHRFLPYLLFAALIVQRKVYYSGADNFTSYLLATIGIVLVLIARPFSGGTGWEHNNNTFSPRIILTTGLSRATDPLFSGLFGWVLMIAAFFVW